MDVRRRRLPKYIQYTEQIPFQTWYKSFCYIFQLRTDGRCTPSITITESPKLGAALKIAVFALYNSEHLHLSNLIHKYNYEIELHTV